METQDGLKTIALTLSLNLFFYFLLQLLCVMISHWLTELKHKMLSQILLGNSWIGLVNVVHLCTPGSSLFLTINSLPQSASLVYHSSLFSLADIRI